MTIQHTAPAAQGGIGALRAALFEQSGDLRLRNIKFFVHGENGDPRKLCEQAASFIDRRVNNHIEIMRNFCEAPRQAKTASGLISSL